MNLDLNHVELVYRPGERQLTARLFELLGCRVIETGGPYLVVQLGGDEKDWVNNVLYASEVTPEQWRFEQELQRVREQAEALQEAERGFEKQLAHEPQRTTHFGLRFASAPDLDRVAARIGHERPAELEGRVRVTGIFRPGDPGSLSDELTQAFVRQDVCAAGLVTLGQTIELQSPA